MRPLPYPVDKGVGKFLPPQALSTVVEWQKGLLERLNDLVRGELPVDHLIPSVLTEFTQTPNWQTKASCKLLSVRH